MNELPESLTRYRSRLRAAIVADDAAARARPRRRLRLALVPVALAAAAAAAVIALVGTGSRGGPASADAAVIRHVAAAVTPPANEILHVKIVGEQNGTAIGGETWQLTSPPYTNVGMKGPLGHQGEQSADGTTACYYDPASNTIYERPDASPQTFVDPVSQVRQELDDGQAQLEGTTTIDGTAVYKVSLPHGLVWYFEKGTYTPVRLDDPQSDGSVVTLNVVAYEYLPKTSETLALLSLRARHPDALVDTNPSDWPGGIK